VLEFHFKAVRCYYVACVYLANKRYIETLSLLKMAENIAVNSAKKFEEMKGFVRTKKNEMRFVSI